MAYKQSPKSPALKALIGNQKNLNEGLKKAILESGEKSSMAKQTMGMRDLSERLPEAELVKELTQEERMEMAKKRAAARKKAKQKRAQSKSKPSRPIIVTPKKDGKSKEGESGKPGKVKDKIQKA